jgi:hypothetical protein
MELDATIEKLSEDGKIKLLKEVMIETHKRKTAKEVIDVLKELYLAEQDDDICIEILQLIETVTTECLS